LTPHLIFHYFINVVTKFFGQWLIFGKSNQQLIYPQIENMSSPSKEELPKIAVDLKSEIEKEHELKPAETEEKVVLPSKEEIQQERTHQELVKGIESFNPDASLKHAETQEKNPLPTKEIIEQEKAAETV